MRRVLYLSIIALLITGCRQKPKNPNANISFAEAQELLIRINRTLSKEDSLKIEDYIVRAGLKDMHMSQTGLYYHISGDGDGPLVQPDDMVFYTYTISLLDSTVCYRSAPNQLQSFRVGRGGVEAGLEEGIRLMREGQQARFILPPHLAHGLVGDGKKIPARAIIVYDIDLVRVDRQ